MGAFISNGKTWSIDTKVKVNGEWKHLKRTGYPTLSAAKADFPRVKKEFVDEHSLYVRAETFETLVNEYEEMRKVIVDISTLEIDKGLFKNHIMPKFQGKTIKEAINRDSIKIWYLQLINDTKLSNPRKSKIITRMKDLLKFAYTHKYINADTYQDCDVEIYQVKYTKKPLTERVIWTDSEEKAFLEALKIDDRDYLMFRLFLLCSPRLGEFLALQPNCIDFKNNKIVIKQQIKYISGTGKPLLTDKLKTHDSYRTIIITKSIALELKNYIDTLGIKDNEFLFFGNDKSMPMGRTTFKRKLYKYCDLANVRRINPHASRHNQAVKLAAVCQTGEEMESAARRLGHSVSVFLETYANHKNDETESSLLNKIMA